jgi:hypothetical protein
MQPLRERLDDSIRLCWSRGGGPLTGAVSRLIDDSGIRLFGPESSSIQTISILVFVLNAGNTSVFLIRRILPCF